MKSTIAVMLFVLNLTAFAQTPNAAQTSVTPAEKSIATAQALIAKNPKNFEAFNALALALSRRARESSDVAFYAQAEEALQKSFAISPDNFDGKRIQVWLLLGRHEFASALQEATKLNRRMPDDVMVYGFLTDADVELGNYKDAETAAQWMLNLRGGAVPALTRAAYLRELFGDVDGALELMQMALESTPPTEAEDRAWILTQMAHLKLSVGKIAEAESLTNQALAAFPAYHYALGNLARIRLQQGRIDDAVRLLKQRYEAAPHAENLFELAEALQRAGRAEDARKAFAEFEEKSLRETNIGDNSNHELIYYYADDAAQPGKALEVASREIGRRHDYRTLEAYAWALSANGQHTEARKQIEMAMSVGVQDAKLFRHAGEIALRGEDRDAARHYFQRAVELNSVGSEEARLTLARLDGTAKIK